jgi:hypothetical protein
MLRVQLPAFTSIRFYSVNAEKLPLKLITELHKLTEVSITKACEALAASNNNVLAVPKTTLPSLVQKGLPPKLLHCDASKCLVAAGVPVLVRLVHTLRVVLVLVLVEQFLTTFSAFLAITTF